MNDIAIRTDTITLEPLAETMDVSALTAEQLELIAGGECVVNAL